MGPQAGQRQHADRGGFGHRSDNGRIVKLGLSYSEKPRLVLIYMAIEVVRTGNPVMDVENSMTGFARSLELETNGQQLKG